MVARMCTPPSARPRAGFSLVELLVVCAVVGIAVLIAAPRARAIRHASAVRAARSELVVAVEAARSAAIQRGRPARFRLGPTGIVATVDTAPPGNASQWMVIYGPDRLDRQFDVTLSTAAPGDSVIDFDARGFASPRLGRVARLVVARPGFRDSVCVSSVGLIMRRGCVL